MAPERLDTTRTVTPMATEATPTRRRGSQVSGGAQAPEPAAQEGQPDEGAHGVGHGEGQGQAAHAEGVHQHHGQRDVDACSRSGRGRRPPWSAASTAGRARRRGRCRTREGPARTWPVPRRWSLSAAGVLCPWPSRRATAGLARRSMPDGGGDDEGQHGAQPSGQAGQEGGASARWTSARPGRAPPPT